MTHTRRFRPFAGPNRSRMIDPKQTLTARGYNPGTAALRHRTESISRLAFAERSETHAAQSGDGGASHPD
jgi:hypothetical protein